MSDTHNSGQAAQTEDPGELSAYEKAVAAKEERIAYEKKQKRKLYIYSALAIAAIVLGLAVVLGYSYA